MWNCCQANSCRFAGVVDCSTVVCQVLYSNKLQFDIQKHQLKIRRQVFSKMGAKCLLLGWDRLYVFGNKCAPLQCSVICIKGYCNFSTLNVIIIDQNHKTRMRGFNSVAKTFQTSIRAIHNFTSVCFKTCNQQSVTERRVQEIHSTTLIRASSSLYSVRDNNH